MQVGIVRPRDILLPRKIPCKFLPSLYQVSKVEVQMRLFGLALLHFVVMTLLGLNRFVLLPIIDDLRLLDILLVDSFSSVT